VLPAWNLLQMRSGSGGAAARYLGQRSLSFCCKKRLIQWSTAL